MVERFELQPGYSISRVIKGGWHLAGGHGNIDEREAINDMRAFVEAGITTFDCADIYTGVEELIGKFLKSHRSDLPDIQIHTKYVPDYNRLASLTMQDTTRIIDRSLHRLGVERLDLVQFSWWDYQFDNYVEVAIHLAALQKQGKIRHVGVTNFDTAHLKEIVDGGVEIASNQVQYSVLDQRPRQDMETFAAEHKIPFLCYGVVAGGFLSDRYLHAPNPAEPLENRSLVKYRLIIDEFGGYGLFQKALGALREIADKHEVGISEIACKYMLQSPMVGAVIVGARNRNHLAKLIQLSDFTLDHEDLKLIGDFIEKSSGPSGPVYNLERDKEGKHGRIMRYNLNEQD